MNFKIVTRPNRILHIAPKACAVDGKEIESCNPNNVLDSRISVMGKKYLREACIEDRTQRNLLPK